MRRLPVGVNLLSLFLLLACACVVPSHGHAQTRQATIGRIIIDGASRFSDVQIVSASGLKVGQAADDPTLDAAATRLSESGAFSEVAYRYQTANGKMTVTLHIVETPKTLLCTFDNFVWFMPEEIDRAVRAEVSLFDGRLPADGSLPQAVATTLEHLLAQRHLAASVIYTPSGQLGKAPTEYLYAAKGDLPTIKSVEYTGGPLEPSVFSIATQRLIGHPYSTNYARSLAENDLDVIYHNHGYLRAHFADAKPAFAPGAAATDSGSVSVVFTVTPGLQYTWRGADWNGNRMYSTADLDQFLGMKAGEIAAADKISSGGDAVHEAYGKKGYITVALSPNQNFDDAAKQVQYSYKVDEGSQYRMGMITVSGADDKVAEKIRKAWRLKAGDIYDASYMKEFVRKDFSAAIAGSPLASPSAHPAISMHPNANTLTVDITISSN
jgi:outer membrane protein assembly factor BamA